MEKEYTYVDLRLHSYMFGADDFESLRDFFRYIFNEEKHSLEDCSDEDIYEGFRRQYEGWVGTWTNECEKQFQFALDKYVRNLH
jgi:hypothetical protein